MAHSVDEYTALLKSLLPPGRAFSRDSGTNMEIFLSGAAVEFSRVEGRADTLARDVNPVDTSELLMDWERVAGLPDRCSAELETTLQGRRAAVVAKLASIGGQSIAYLIEVAAALGFTITITNFRPFEVGRSRVGEALTNGSWVFAWRVNAPAVTITSFRTGLSAVGEPLRVWGNGILECKLRSLAPAHTIPIFTYGG